MLNFSPSKIYISSANIDMRKQIDGLASIVEQQFKLDAMTNMMFVFHNRHCDKVKSNRQTRPTYAQPDIHDKLDFEVKYDGVKPRVLDYENN